MGKIDVKNLDLYYGSFQALKNINLNLPENEISAFIGPSGCGKSTLLKSLNRMNDLVEGCKITGEITLDGENIYQGMDVNPVSYTHLVLVEDGKIKKIGRTEELRLESDGCQWVDLHGAAMLPGFLDAHSHFISYATSLMQVDLDGAESIDEITKRVQQFIRDHNVPAGDWVKAVSYTHLGVL